MNKKILIAVIAVTIVVVCAVVGYFIIQGQQKVGLRLSVGNYIEYEYNFTGTYVGEMEGTIRAEVTEVNGVNYTVRVDYSPTDGSDAWTETDSYLLGEDFMCPLTHMLGEEHNGDGNAETAIGRVLISTYYVPAGKYHDYVIVHRESKILVCRDLCSPEPTGEDSWIHFVPKTVIKITDTNIEWFTVD